MYCFVNFWALLLLNTQMQPFFTSPTFTLYICILFANDFVFVLFFLILYMNIIYMYNAGKVYTCII